MQVFKSALIAAALLVILCGCRRSRENVPDFSDALKQQGLSFPAFAGFHLDGEPTGGADNSTLLFRAVDGGRHVVKTKIVKVADLGAAIDYARGQKVAIEFLFKPSVTPYLGNLSSTERCSPVFFPKILSFKGHDVLSLASGARLNFGVCEIADLIYDSYLIFLYDEAGPRLVQLELYVPRGGKSDLFEKTMGDLPAGLQSVKINEAAGV